MDIDRLKNDWKEMNVGTGATLAVDTDNIAAVASHHGSHLDYMKRRLVVMMIICALMPGVSTYSLDSLGLPSWYLMAFGGFFIVMGLLIFATWLLTRSLNFTTMSVKQLIGQLVGIQRLRIVHKIVGMSLAIPLLVYIFIFVAGMNDGWMLGGCFGGLVVGAAIGFITDRRIRHTLTRLKQSLIDIDDAAALSE